MEIAEVLPETTVAEVMPEILNPDIQSFKMMIGIQLIQESGPELLDLVKDNKFKLSRAQQHRLEKMIPISEKLLKELYEGLNPTEQTLFNNSVGTIDDAISS